MTTQTFKETTHRLYHIPNEDDEFDPHLILVVMESETWRDGSLGGGKLRAPVYAISGPLRRYRSSGAFLGSFGGNYDITGNSEYNRFKVTGGSMILDEPARGLRIGGIVQNLVIEWCKAAGQDGRVEPIRVAQSDALTVKERDRRNHFYRRFGILFRWHAPSAGALPRAVGRSFEALRLNQLKLVPLSSTIYQHDMAGSFSHLADLLSAARHQCNEAKKAKVHMEKMKDREIAGAMAISTVAWKIAAILGSLTLVLAFFLGHELRQ